MKSLHNKIDKRILKEKLQAAPQARKTLSFYKYHHIPDPESMRNALFHLWSDLDVMGRVYIAMEGINAQVSVPDQNFEGFKKSLSQTGFLQNVRLNTAIEDNGQSFFVLKIQVKKKIVADGLHDEHFDVTDSGKHLDAPAFNTLIDSLDTIVVDMRNHYESEVGHFKNALRPDVDTFKESLPVVEKMLENQKDENIILYCTGGIRCEKASAWMKHRGFKNIFQLDGGIIEYTRQARTLGLENKFIGKNFVFDERLGERISTEVISVCHQCGKPCDNHTNCKNEGCHILFIQCEACAKKMDGCCSEECKEVVSLPVEDQKKLRQGVNKGRQVYKKGKSSKLLFKKS